MMLLKNTKMEFVSSVSCIREYSSPVCILNEHDILITSDIKHVGIIIKNLCIFLNLFGRNRCSTLGLSLFIV